MEVSISLFYLFIMPQKRKQIVYMHVWDGLFVALSLIHSDDLSSTIPFLMDRPLVWMTRMYLFDNNP